MTALYIRLSREDGGGRESNSVATQRTILSSYALGAGLLDTKEYVDDGYSGTGTDRPAFRLMQADIDRGLVDTVIVKDLSRLARNSAVANSLIDEYFPLHRVRLISVSEGIDTSKGGAVFAPLANMMHEFYSRDISGKIRTALYAKMDEGRYVGARPPFGYSVIDGKLFPNDDAYTVREIFDLANRGVCPAEIGQKLDMTSRRVRRIIGDPVYLGHLEQGKTRKLSFKSSISVSVPRDERHIVRNMHEPIVNPEIYRIANEKLQKRSKLRSGFQNVFSGIAFCADCGSRMSTVGTRRRGSPCALACSEYKRHGPDRCTNHHIDYITLLNGVRDALRINMPSPAEISCRLGMDEEMAGSLVSFDDLNSEILFTLVERIDVYQGTKGRNREQRISLVFRFSSCVES